MIASLPMYDWPELHEATNAFWQAIQNELEGQGFACPARLERDQPDEAVWLSPNLLLSQTCGYPFATNLHDKVQYVATPVYAVPGCKGAHYSSAIIAHKDSFLEMHSLENSSLAFNSKCSLSGYRVLFDLFGDPQSHFGQLRQTHGHRKSARLIASKSADVAAIDAVCWHFLKKFEPETADQLKVVGWSNAFPALPMITAKNTNDKIRAALRLALKRVVATQKYAKICGELAIGGYEIINPKRYEKLALLAIAGD